MDIRVDANAMELMSIHSEVVRHLGETYPQNPEREVLQLKMMMLQTSTLVGIQDLLKTISDKITELGNQLAESEYKPLVD